MEPQRDYRQAHRPQEIWIHKTHASRWTETAVLVSKKIAFLTKYHCLTSSTPLASSDHDRGEDINIVGQQLVHGYVRIRRRADSSNLDFQRPSR